jgi:cytochrome c
MKKILLIALIAKGLYATTIVSDVNATIQKNGCFNCHTVVGAYKAPPFAGIARRNIRWYGQKIAKERLINAIKNGSKGKYPRFENTQMPSFSNLNEKELNSIATWILSLGDEFFGRWHFGE